MATMGTILSTIKNGPCRFTLYILFTHGIHPFRFKYDLTTALFIFTLLIFCAVTVFFYEYGLLVVTMSCFGSASALLYTFQTRFRFRGPTPV